MRILKKGDACPLCGQPILTDDPNALRLLAAIADIAGLPEPGKEEETDAGALQSPGGRTSE